MEYTERKIEPQDIKDESLSDEVDPLQDKIDIIFLKHQLICAPEIDLTEAFSAEEEYGAFIDIFNVALEAEPAFFLLNDEFLKTAEGILYSKRFEYMHTANYNEIINDIIGRINHLKGIHPYLISHQVSSYINWNLEVRQLGSIMKETEFYRVLGRDANLIQGLINGDIEDIEPYYFFSSTNYLATVMPELYEQNPEMLDMTMQKLDHSIQKRWFWNLAERDFARETQKKLYKVKSKEE